MKLSGCKEVLSSVSGVSRGRWAAAAAAATAAADIRLQGGAVQCDGYAAAVWC
jgi:hypothetical protein